jgi:hypothetical protein
LRIAGADNFTVCLCRGGDAGGKQGAEAVSESRIVHEINRQADKQCCGFSTQVRNGTRDH